MPHNLWQVSLYVKYKVLVVSFSPKYIFDDKFVAALNYNSFWSLHSQSEGKNIQIYAIVNSKIILFNIQIR